MKKVMFIFLVTIVMLLLMSNSRCDDMGPSKSNVTLNAQQENLMQEANRQAGIPNVKNFKQRKLMKLIIEQCDQENLICYDYIVAEMTGKLIYIGRSIGYGLPYATQYTNPSITERHMAEGGGNVVLPQADPDGLFKPASAEGTWLLMLDDKNEPHVVYVEPRVIVSPFKLN